MEEFRVRNVQLVSAQESLDTGTPTGRAFLTMVAIFAELEREWLRERTIHGLWNAIGRILDDPELALRLSEQSRDKVARKFHHRRSAEALAQCLGVIDA